MGSLEYVIFVCFRLCFTFNLPFVKTDADSSSWLDQQAVVVSPDAGGAKRATAIADSLGMPFALIHKVWMDTWIVAKLELIQDSRNDDPLKSRESIPKGCLVAGHASLHF